MKPFLLVTARFYYVCIVLLFSALLPGSTIQAQPSLVKDINTNPELAYLNANNLTEMNGIIYFSGTDKASGQELWRTDGTPQGTYLVKDIIPGEVGGNPENLINVNGTLYFTAKLYSKPIEYYTNTGGFELWKSDGTAAGTVKVTDVGLGSMDIENPGYYSIYLTKAGNKVFFTSNNDSYSFTLSKSDGTTAGTAGLVGINPMVSPYSYGPSLTDIDVNGILYFLAEDGFWKSDGTTSGTIKIKGGLFPGDTEDNPYDQNLLHINGNFYFVGYDGKYGNELWKSNGTTAGTVMVKNMLLGAHNPKYLTKVNNIFYFTADNGVNGRELWKSDGTDAGTTMVKDIVAGASGSMPANLTVVNGILYFTAANSVNGRELWKTDGTAAGTVMVKDIFPGAGNSTPQQLTASNNILYFTANNGVNGTELWKTDGTAAGTVMVKEFIAGAMGTGLYEFTVVNGTLYFIANLNGNELWRSNGTAAGTVKVGIQIQNSANTSSSPRNLINVNNILYFTASSGIAAHELWKSNGTTAGTKFVKDIYGGHATGAPYNLTHANGSLFFTSAHIGNIHKLWKSAGTIEAAGAISVKDFEITSYYGGGIKEMIALNGSVYFSLSGAASGNGLWKSNGTATGTVLVKEMAVQSLTVYNGVLYFFGNDGVTGNELWKSDGTTAGTSLVKDINPGAGGIGNFGSSASLIVDNGVLYFMNYRALWKSNGTAAGTTFVKNVITSEYTSDIQGERMAIANGKLFLHQLIGQDYDVNPYSLKLFATDLTTSTTVVNLLTTESGFYASGGNVPALTSLNGHIYVSVSNGSRGNELWRSNGTAAGTGFVADINPGVGDASPDGFQALNGNVFFAANDGKTGVELWKYDAVNCAVAIQPNLTLQGGTVCAGSNGSIVIKASQTGVNYQAYINKDAVGKAVKGGGDITLTIPAGNLSAGANTITIQASGCLTVPLSTSVTITVNKNCVGAPTSLTAKAVSRTQIHLLWNANYSATGYIVERAVSASGPFSVIKTISYPSESSFADTTLHAGKTYFYRTKAVKSGLTAPYSSIVSATTQSTVSSPAEATALWNKRFGGSSIEVLQAVVAATDGGFLLAGRSRSGLEGDRSEASRGGLDYWVVKMGSSGAKQWDKRFGGTGYDAIHAAVRTSDGGYLLGGTSSSLAGGDKTETIRGAGDYWLVKISSTGVKQWDKTYGGNALDEFRSLIPTSDGGFLVGGYSLSGMSGEKLQASRGKSDYWVIKINSSGVKQWDKTFGGSDSDDLSAMIQTTDGGFLLGGTSLSSIGGERTQATRGASDYWLVKISSTGLKQWDKRYGGEGADQLAAIGKTADGGYLLGGSSASGAIGDKTKPASLYQNDAGNIKGANLSYWVLKISSTGTKLWDNSFKSEGDGNMGVSNSILTSLVSTTDGGFVLAGSSASAKTTDKSEGSRAYSKPSFADAIYKFNLQHTFDYYMVKINSSGTRVWDKTLGGFGSDQMSAMLANADGSLLLAGTSDSKADGDKSEAGRGRTDYWVVRTRPANVAPAITASASRIASQDTETVTLAVFPNPATSGQVTASASGLARNETIQLSLYNSLGTPVLSLQLRADESGRVEELLEIEQLPAGAYVVLIKTAAHLQSQKLIIGK